MKAVLLLIGCATALRLPNPAPFVESAKAATAACALSALLVAGPVHAGVPEAAKDFTDAACKSLLC